jgi:hypothetical protein
MARANNRRLQVIIAEMDAEDRAIRLLGCLPKRVAAVAALRAAVELASTWGFEKREMLRRRQNRPVYLDTPQERHWLFSTAAQYCVDPSWEHCPASEVRDEWHGRLGRT